MESARHVGDGLGPGDKEEPRQRGRDLAEGLDTQREPGGVQGDKGAQERQEDAEGNGEGGPGLGHHVEARGDDGEDEGDEDKVPESRASLVDGWHVGVKEEDGHAYEKDEPYAKAEECDAHDALENMALGKRAGDMMRMLNHRM